MVVWLGYWGFWGVDDEECGWGLGRYMVFGFGSSLNMVCVYCSEFFFFCMLYSCVD